jgi:hypothetical protein
MLSMSAIDRQGQKELNIGKAFINTRRVNSAKFDLARNFKTQNLHVFGKKNPIW